MSGAQRAFPRASSAGGLPEIELMANRSSQLASARRAETRGGRAGVGPQR